MIIGTHNSATAGPLVWWQRPLAFILTPTSRCQEKSIAEQLKDGVKLFNLQITHYCGKWHFSHGLCIYKETLFEALGIMRAAARRDAPIYFQLYLDKCFFCKQKKELFRKLVKDIKNYYCAPHFVMLSAWIEGSNEYPHKARKGIDKREHYWTKAWGKAYGKGLADRLPLPQRHAKLHNKEYKECCNSKYLMLDFYNI